MKNSDKPQKSILICNLPVALEDGIAESLKERGHVPVISDTLGDVSKARLYQGIIIGPNKGVSLENIKLLQDECHPMVVVCDNCYGVVEMLSNGLRECYSSLEPPSKLVGALENMMTASGEGYN